jgi:hypothetical protein
MTRYVRYLSCSIKIIISALIFLISISPGPLYDNSYAVMVAEIIPILYLMGQIASLVAMVAHKKPLLCHSVQTCIVLGGLYLVYFAPIDVRVHFWNTAFYVGWCEIGRAAAGDHIARDRPGRAAKTKQWRSLVVLAYGSR